MSKNTGGPAFPRIPQRDSADQYELLNDGAEGMMLRDYFAAKAMQALLSPPERLDHYQEIAKRSYQLADYMLAERDK